MLTDIPASDPALKLLDYCLLLVDALGWSGQLDLQINGARCVRIVPEPHLPLLHPTPEVKSQLSPAQQEVRRRVAQRLATLEEGYVGDIYVPISEGLPGTPRERPRFVVYPAGTGKG